MICPCAHAKQLEALVGGLKKENQVIIWHILGHVADAMKFLYKPLMAIAYANNKVAADQVFSSEKIEDLKALGKVFGF